jgi:hypothetical protein
VECSLVDGGDKQTAQPSIERLKAGIRAMFRLPPKGELALRVSESRTYQSSVELVSTSRQHDDLKTQWLEQNLVVTNGPLARHPGVQKCLEIQQRLDAKQQEISAAVQETERLSARQERLRKNIAAGGHDEQTTRWRLDLGEADNRTPALEQQSTPRLRAAAPAIRDELRTALLSLAAEWTAE